MDFKGMGVMQLFTLAYTEVLHKERVAQCKQMWTDYKTELDHLEERMTTLKNDLYARWFDKAGRTFEARVTESALTIYEKSLFAAVAPPALDTLATAIDTMKEEVDAAYEAYMAAYKPVDNSPTDMSSDGTATTSTQQSLTNWAAEEAAKKAIIAALETLDTAYITASDELVAAAAAEVKWKGPQSGGPTASPASPGRAPGGPAAPPGGPAAAPEAPAAEAPQENAEAPAGDPAGAPPGGAPSLSGGPAAPPSLPPGATVPRVPLPPGFPQLPTMPPGMPPFIPPVTGIPTLPPRLPGGSAPSIPGITPRTGVPGISQVPGMASLPLAATPGVAAPAPQPGTAPTMPVSGAPAAAKPTASGSSMPPPMTPPPTTGSSGGGGPKPGTADHPRDKRKARPAKNVPGVPPKLRGRAGKLDGQFVTSPRVNRNTRSEEEVSSVQFLDEELWQVDDTAERRRLTAE
ncbi:hypothetical protein UK23_33260 [Lentzea aerocolonigenes]|uniref:PPE family domain-containing protein n=1 Tax=Lentzea aerocolonigenes TaxID=68170 RepID=A0A0F0GIV6_LENAE|nr:hypothetical protein [Lentzea aerocolonigenes]KJK43439.1 hypothetical protein UK23_33260 [Lentzea aerocolonigenes]